MCRGTGCQSSRASPQPRRPSTKLGTPRVLIAFFLFVACCLGSDVHLARSPGDSRGKTTIDVLSGLNSVIAGNGATDEGFWGVGGMGRAMFLRGLENPKSSGGGRHLDSDDDAADSDEDTGFSWDRFLVLTTSCVLIVGVGIFGIALPSIFKKCTRTEGSWCGAHAALIESACNAFAAGAFWGLAFFHVLCEAIDTLDATDTGIHIGPSFYNLTYLLIFAGFIFIYSLDRFLNVISSRSLAKFNRLISRGVDPNGLSDETPHAVLAKLLERQAILQGICATVGLSIHSFFEGMIIGMRDSNLLIAIATISVLGHKWAAAFALTQKLNTANVNRKWVWTLLSIFILSTPIGIYVGMPLGMGGDSVVVGVFNALCVGILVFVAADATRDIVRPTNWKVEADVSDAESDSELDKYCPDSEPDDCSHFSKAEPETRVSDPAISKSRLAGIRGMCDDHNEDLLATSWVANIMRVLFICVGAALIFAMMCIHLSDPGHEHGHLSH